MVNTVLLVVTRVLLVVYWTCHWTCLKIHRGDLRHHFRSRFSSALALLRLLLLLFLLLPTRCDIDRGITSIPGGQIPINSALPSGLDPGHLHNSGPTQSTPPAYQYVRSGGCATEFLDRGYIASTHIQLIHPTGGEKGNKYLYIAVTSTYLALGGPP